MRSELAQVNETKAKQKQNAYYDKKARNRDDGWIHLIILDSLFFCIET
jgi:hypothetical protein